MVQSLSWSVYMLKLLGVGTFARNRNPQITMSLKL